MTSKRRAGGRRDPEYINDTGGAIRIRFDGESPEPRTALAAVKARLLRSGFLVVLAITLGVAAVTVLTGLPNLNGGNPQREASTLAAASQATAASDSRRAGQSSTASEKAGLPSRELRFLDSDEAGRLAYHDGNYDEALSRFTAAFERDPADAESMSNAAQILVRLGRAPEALPLLRRAVELNGTRWAYRFNLARALDQVGEIDQAVKQYEAASVLFPDDYATLFNLGQAYHKQGNEPAAVERYQRAITLNPGEPTFHFALAVSLEKEGKNAEAGEAYARFLELAPASPEAARVRERINQLQSGTGQATGEGVTPGAEKPTVK